METCETIHDQWSNRTKVPTGNCLKIYIDASSDDVSAGVGAALDDGTTVSRRLKFKTSSNEAEKIALWWALEEFSTTIVEEPGRINVWTDSLNLIRDLDKTLVFSENLWSCNSKLIEIATMGKRIEVGWLSKKAGAPGLIRADEAARAGRYSSELAINVESFSSTASAIERDICLRNENAWQLSIKDGKLECPRILLNGFSDDRFGSLLKSGRMKLKLLMYIFTGNAPLFGLLSKIDPNIKETCRFCKSGKESMIHLLRDCNEQSIRRAREKAFGISFPNEDTLKKAKVEEYVAFSNLINLGDIVKTSQEKTGEPETTRIQTWTARESRS